MQKNEKGNIINSQVKDSGGKIIFGDNTLCSQFLRDYIPLPYLKDVQPEDIEDVSERFVPLFAEERNADRVKKVNIRGEKPFFLVSLIEHKTYVDYNVCMQIFRYMVYIWDAYEKEAEDLVGKVREKKMGMLFENMEKMDIQEERRKTAEQRRKTEEECKKTEEERRKAEEQRYRAEVAERRLENSMRLFIDNCYKTNVSQNDTIGKVMEIYQLEKKEAEEKVEVYWNCEK